MKPVLYIVIPCYNEEKVLPITIPMFLEQLRTMQKEGLVSENSKIMFVNDGSKDKTWEIITALAQQEPSCIGISQSRNRGHQNAVLAGMMEAMPHCDITITIDCDGQDDLRAMSDMVREYLSGTEIVYGVRSSRKTDTFFKRNTAQLYYKFLKLLGADVVYNHADYRLVSSRVLREFANFREVNLFLRGMFPLVGFQSAIVYYDRTERLAGDSHYPLKKMIALAWNGVTSLSAKPLHMIYVIGLVLILAGFAGIVWAVLAGILGNAVETWVKVVMPVLLVCGVQLFCLGIVGDYIGKMYMEIKDRPRYIISDRTEQNEK